MNTASRTLSTVHFASIAAMPKTERAPLLANMTQAELRGYARYLFVISDLDEEFDAWLASFPGRILTADDVDD